MARAKNETLPGIPDMKVIKEISDSAEEYENYRDKRMAALTKEIEANAALVGLMKKHKLKEYKDSNYSPPLLVTLAAKDPTTKARVRRGKEEEEE